MENWWQSAFDFISSSSNFISTIDSGRFTHNPVRSPSKYSTEARLQAISASSSTSDSLPQSQGSSMTSLPRREDNDSLCFAEVGGESFLTKIKTSWESASHVFFPKNNEKLKPNPSWCKMTDPSVYVMKQQYLMDCLEESKSILATMMEFNKNRWCIKFPPKGSSKILSLNLKTSGYEDADLVLESMEESSIKNMVDSKLLEVCDHVERLSSRIKDTTSKILVTGDVNAGKSTFVNSLLKKNLLPSDQQPCTLAFCEVINAKNNNDREEVHIVKLTKDGSNPPYHPEDTESYQRLDLCDIFSSVTSDDLEHENHPVKIYCKSEDEPTSSILHNEAVDLVLIDSPGLNCDSFKTMSLYAKQEDIDVVIFVVNAANHLTLSAQEFLSIVAKEKSFVFIVVNRFDDIRDKERCKLKIMNQIRSVLPQTFENSSDLVHFVSSKAYLERILSTPGKRLNESVNLGHADDDPFYHLEASLSDFILEKRTKSKLSPAKTFVVNLLRDLENLSDFNLKTSKEEAVQCTQKMLDIVPKYEDLIQRQSEFSGSVEKSIEEASARIESNCADIMQKFLDDLETFVEEIPWHGPLDMHNYALESVCHLNSVAFERFRCCRQLSKRLSESVVLEMIHSSAGLLSGNVQATVENSRKNHPFPQLSTDQAALDNDFEFSILDTFSSLLYVDSFPSILGFTSALFAMLGQYSRFFALPFRINISQRSFIAITGVFGVGGVFLLTRNLQKKLNVRICEKVRNYYQISSVVRKQSNILIQHCQRNIRSTAWDLQREFAQAIASQQKQITDLKSKRKIASESENFFSDLKSHVSVLKEHVSSVEV